MAGPSQLLTIRETRQKSGRLAHEEAGCCVSCRALRTVEVRRDKADLREAWSLSGGCECPGLDNSRLSERQRRVAGGFMVTWGKGVWCEWQGGKSCGRSERQRGFVGAGAIMFTRNISCYYFINNYLLFQLMFFIFCL